MNSLALDINSDMDDASSFYSLDYPATRTQSFTLDIADLIHPRKSPFSSFNQSDDVKRFLDEMRVPALLDQKSKIAQFINDPGECKQINFNKL